MIPFSSSPHCLYMMQTNAQKLSRVLNPNSELRVRLSRFPNPNPLHLVCKMHRGQREGAAFVAVTYRHKT